MGRKNLPITFLTLKTYFPQIAIATIIITAAQTTQKK